GEFNDDNRNWGWGAAILPYIEQTAIYNNLMKSTVTPFANSSGVGFMIFIPGGGPNQFGTSGVGLDADTANNNGIVNATAGGGVAKAALSVYMCPSDPWPTNTTSGGYGKLNYLACMGSDVTNGAFNSWSNPSGKNATGVLVQANDNK